MVDWIELQSSVVSAAAYQGSSLYIRFTSDHEYEYYNVPETIYEHLLRAPSIGQYFNANIRDHYDYRQLI